MLHTVLSDRDRDRDRHGEAVASSWLCCGPGEQAVCSRHQAQGLAPVYPWQYCNSEPNE